MGKLRRGGFVFVWWKGDHPPRHVHVYRDGKLMVKWDLANKKAMKGRASRRIINLIEMLESEGML
ncbi:MAG TPA: DUF4160 domain-containing protein [Candidatus Binatia bacterium]|jgi:Domain of unknown function (DUF4160)|nr:DUF4160 domain-containing protein [Candidatus Binatia bacterium]